MSVANTFTAPIFSANERFPFTIAPSADEDDRKRTASTTTGLSSTVTRARVSAAQTTIVRSRTPPSRTSTNPRTRTTHRRAHL